jgi:16S rRNA U1498 N3-methylase RsmE
VLVDAQKVEKDYFGSHLFRRPQALRAGLVEGLEIANVDCHVPPVLVRRRLHKFLSEELDELFPVDEYTRLFAHPTKTSGPVTHETLSQVLARSGGGTQGKKKRCVLAIGPEGGWSDGEVELFSGQHGFLPFSTGTRILRTDVAVPVLLGLVRELFREPC